MLLNCGVDKTLERVPWTGRRSNQSILKEISPECSLEGMMLKLQLQYFGHLTRSWLIGKDSDAGRDWGEEEKGTTEDEIAGWHHRLDGHECEWTPGVGDGQGGLACCDSWGQKELDTTEWLNWTELNVLVLFFLENPSIILYSSYKEFLNIYGIQFHCFCFSSETHLGSDRFSLTVPFWIIVLLISFVLT